MAYSSLQFVRIRIAVPGISLTASAQATRATSASEFSQPGLSGRDARGYIGHLGQRCKRTA
jgi:hypothetical protein